MVEVFENSVVRRLLLGWSDGYFQFFGGKKLEQTVGPPFDLLYAPYVKKKGVKRNEQVLRPNRYKKTEDF